MPRWLWVYGAVVAIVLISLGGWLLLELRDPAPPAVSSSAELAEAGCTAGTRQPDLGGGHLGPEEMVNSAPSLIYPDQPPSSGPHVGQVVSSGVFDVVIDPRITTHNLEHGYVVIWYDVDTSPADLAALRAWADAGLTSDHPKLVVAEYPIRLPNEADVVLTAWFQRQACDGSTRPRQTRSCAPTTTPSAMRPNAGCPRTCPAGTACSTPPDRTSCCRPWTTSTDAPQPAPAGRAYFRSAIFSAMPTTARTRTAPTIHLRMPTMVVMTR